MQNADIATLLDELADLLEIKGANPFRVRAYRNAVRTVETRTRPLADMVAAGEDLTSLPGVGKEMASHITAMVETGRFPMLEEVAEEIPRSLVVLTKLDGVGPKKAGKLHEALGIETVDELEVAIRDGEVEALEGFGKRSCEKILTAIEELRSMQGRYQLADVEALIAGVLSHMEDAPGLERLEVAGSYRRRKETVGDVDLLAQVPDGEDGAPVVRHFVGYAGAARIEASGGTKGSIVLRSGLQVDLRVIPAESWGAALHYFTGSKEHNVRIRQMAQRRGLRVSEWGVEEDGARTAGATEEEIFAAVGLPWIPPELREDRGEIEAGLEDRLPRLVTEEDILGDLQMHSTWSDGKNTVEEMARACRDRGYAYMAVTDHSPALAMVQGLTPERARRQWVEIEEVRERVGGIRILRSCEVDILKDGSLDMPDEILEELDLVVVSVHSFMDMEREAMTERVLTALEHPSVDILAHPTGRIINRRTPFPMDVEAVLQEAKEREIAVELNADPKRLDLSDVHALRARELGVKVVISTDAHSVRGLANMRHGVAQARRGWLEPGQVLNCMDADAFDRWLRRRG